MLGQTRLIFTPVEVVSQTIAVAILGAGVRGTVILRRSWFVGAQVVFVGNPISISVGTPLVLGRTWLGRALVISVRDPVAIKVRAAPQLAHPWFPWALVHVIMDTVAVQVLSPGATVALCHPGFIGASILRIRHRVPISVPLCGRRAPSFLPYAYLVGAGIVGVGDAVSVSIGAALRRPKPWLVGAQISLVGYSVVVSVRHLTGFHHDRRIGADPFRVEGSHGESMSAR
jgi:hypothetical protein